MTQDLERQGFAVVPRVIDPATVAALVSAIESLQAGASASALEREGQVYASRNLLGDLPIVRRLAELASIRDLVEPVLGSDAFPVRALLFDKSPAANWMVPWHQDLTIAVKERRAVEGYRAWTVKAGVNHVQPPVLVLERMLTVRLHLDDCGSDDGPLRVVPGSHREGRLDAGQTRAWLERVDPLACHVPAGGAILMRPLILHASSAAERPTHRRVVHIEFAADPLPGGLDWYEPMPRPVPVSLPTPLS